MLWSDLDAWLPNLTTVLQLTSGQHDDHQQYLVRLVITELSWGGLTRLCFDSRQRQMSRYSAKAMHTLSHMTRSDPRAPKTPTVYVERKVGQHADTFYCSRVHIFAVLLVKQIFSLFQNGILCIFFLSKYDWSLKSRCEQCDCLSVISSVCLFQCNILYIKSNRGQYRL